MANSEPKQKTKRKVKQVQNCKVTNGNSERKILSSVNEKKKCWKNNKTKLNSSEDNPEIQTYPNRKNFFQIIQNFKS